jgi:hypothetical protein
MSKIWIATEAKNATAVSWRDSSRRLTAELIREE